MLTTLIIIHILSAVLGLGPAYAFPFMLKSTNSLQAVKHSVALVARLEMFPKVFGTLAVLSGLLLIWLGSYGSILQIWLIGTLIIYAGLEVIVIGFLNPAAKILQAQLADLPHETDEPLPSLVARKYAHVRNLHTIVGAISLLIFILMIVKPA